MRILISSQRLENSTGTASPGAESSVSAFNTLFGGRTEQNYRVHQDRHLHRPVTSLAILRFLINATFSSEASKLFKHCALERPVVPPLDRR